jgi:20S proteasome alpha/beta subunit
MTLIIGIRCKDGLVMVADSMSTEAAPLNTGNITKHEAEKIVAYKDILWGSSGSVGVKQVIQHELEKDYGNWFQRNISPVDLRQRLVRKIQPILREQYRLVGEFSNNHPAHIPFTNFIFGVYLTGGFALLNIESNCAGEVVEAHHCATGSGQKTGQALLRRLRNQEWDVKTGLVVAYRTMNDAIHVEPQGIGPPIRLARYTLGKGNPCVEKISNDSAEYKAIEDSARAWTALEQETLEKLKAGTSDQAAPATIPSP